MKKKIECLAFVALGLAFWPITLGFLLGQETQYNQMRRQG